MIVSQSQEWAVCLIFFVNPLSPAPTPVFWGCSHLQPGPSGVSSSVDFHHRRVSTTLTPESVSYMLAMVFVWEDCRCSEWPSILFLHVLDGVCGEGRVWRGRVVKGGQEFESRRNVKLMSLAQCIILWSKKNWGPLLTVFIGLYLPSFSFSWQVDSSLLWAAFLFFVFLLPQFSKDSDASGLAPTLSINQFKSNKCGIFSRTGVHSPCLTV